MSRPHTPLTSPDTPATPKRRAVVLESPFILEGPATDDGNTPRKRLKTGTSISTTLKLNARADIHDILVLNNPSLSKKRDVCVVSGMTDEMDVIEYSHVVARTTRPATLDKCEWCWGMDYYTLNLDTRKNLQSLRVNLHRFFDMPQTGWLWVPTDLDIMTRFENAYKVNTRKKPTELYEVEETKFSYYLVAAPQMSNRHISIYDPSLKSNDPVAFQRHFYPFTTLPKFEINVHPHFVIFNTGFKLEQIFGSGAVLAIATLSNYFNITGSLVYSLKSCYDVYRVWMSASPPEAFLHSENRHWEDLDAARRPAGTSSSGKSEAGGSRSAGRNTRNTNPGPLGGGGGSSTVDRETVPLGTDTPDDFVDTELVMPDDSISLLLGDDDESQSHQAREEEEEEDHEAFFRGVEKWAEDVCEAAEDGASDHDHDSSDSDTSSHNKTLIGNTPPSKCGELEDVTMTDVSLKIGLTETSHQPPIFHSFWDTY
ncbi:hypothetical protein PC9H_001834 [Pleurotus ostreatus]|uniref:HNH nuclease domain-containing protein n=1 Tax=Pleurotus ostreatus TaxID=5322 RepID=A0A8H6ZJQ0_PLEOS|nr:uncharacterized protein PC9H_001834 [Pleurotus ostreatus]KAF7419247.1 hypothetical protein PC9H_001834 [Pleurotus ostreatus]